MSVDAVKWEIRQERARASRAKYNASEKGMKAEERKEAKRKAGVAIRKAMKCYREGLFVEEWQDAVRARALQYKREYMKVWEKTNAGRRTKQRYEQDRTFQRSLKRKGMTRADHAVIVMMRIMDEVAPTRRVVKELTVEGLKERIRMQRDPMYNTGRSRVEGQVRYNGNGLVPCKCGNEKVKVRWVGSIQRYVIECGMCGRRCESRQASAIRNDWNFKQI